MTIEGESLPEGETKCEGWPRRLEYNLWMSTIVSSLGRVSLLLVRQGRRRPGEREERVICQGSEEAD